MIKRTILFFPVFFLVLNLYGQAPGSGGVQQLKDALNSGNVTLTANGTGNSSGFAVNGFLKNNSRSEIRVNVIVEDGIYLLNSGAGQNMVIIQVFLSGGRYFFDNRNFFISLAPNENTGVVFEAYCANFDLDNPSRNETFSVAPMPPGLGEIVSQISKFAADNIDSDDDLTTAAQLALWRTQGNSKTQIAEEFGFDEEDWNLSTYILNYK